MPHLTNTTDQPISASTGHTVAPGETLAVSQQTLERLASEPYIARVMRQGKLVLGHDAPEPEPTVTRESIAKMKRGDLLDVILSHYGDDVTEADFEGITVDDKDGEDGLRTIAARLVFADL